MILDDHRTRTGLIKASNIKTRTRSSSASFQAAHSLNSILTQAVKTEFVILDDKFILLKFQILYLQTVKRSLCLGKTGTFVKIEIPNIEKPKNL